MRRAGLLSFSVITSFLFAVSAFATVTNVNVSGGYSRYTESSSTSGGTTTTTRTIFGGYTGPYGECASGTSSSATCNSCTGMGNLGSTPQFACSYSSIHPSLYLTITFQVDTVAAGSSYLVKLNANSTQAISTGIQTSPASPAANTTLTVRIPWSSICEKGDVTATCTNGAAQASFTGTLDVGLSTDNSTFTSGMSQQFQIRFHYRDGVTSNNVIPVGCNSEEAFCQFKALPGDEKVYITELARGATAPGGQSAVKWQSVRVFAAINTGTGAVPLGLGAMYADLDVTDKDNVTTSLSNNKMTGLTNEQEYMFTIGSVDEATIVQDILDTTSAPANYIARPGKVVGLLDNKCFIATAAFGSPAEPHVKTLRQFRDQFLLTNAAGKKFVEIYYQYSPPVADFIAQHEVLRAMVRLALWPLIATAEISFAVQTWWETL